MVRLAASVLKPTLPEFAGQYSAAPWESAVWPAMCYKLNKDLRVIIVRQLVFLVGLQLAATTGRVVDFDGFPVGATPPGWTVSANNPGQPPPWEIRKDQSAPTQPYVLAQVSGASSPLATLDGVMLRDGEISVRLKPGSGSGGIVWRLRDPRNYYLVRANAADQTVGVFRVMDGRTTPILAPVKHEIPGNAWTILKVSARGNRFQVYVDHRRIVDGQDASFTAAGKVGLCTLAESAIYFDDFRVNPR